MSHILVTGGDPSELQLIIFVIISEELTKELDSKTHLSPQSTNYFVKVTSHPGVMSRPVKKCPWRSRTIRAKQKVAV